MKTEYIIWGITQDTNYEQILLTSVKGAKITDRSIAKYWAERITEKHHCTKVRIQEINLTDGFNKSFTKSLIK